MPEDVSAADRDALYRVIGCRRDDNDALRAGLGIPAHVVPVACLCVGSPREFLDTPELERRLPLEDVVHHERWEGQPVVRPRRSA
jgi:nitroreductase